MRGCTSGSRNSVTVTVAVTSVSVTVSVTGSAVSVVVVTVVRVKSVRREAQQQFSGLLYLQPGQQVSPLIHAPVQPAPMSVSPSFVRRPSAAPPAAPATAAASGAPIPAHTATIVAMRISPVCVRPRGPQGRRRGGREGVGDRLASHLCGRAPNWDEPRFPRIPRTLLAPKSGPCTTKWCFARRCCSGDSRRYPKWPSRMPTSNTVPHRGAVSLRTAQRPG
ncbi:hypothetical protein DFJ74DRAFT_693751 [Hyaloraphidium curvatum]|nr:hypothetical protein DFJ74DRAFT_693751 [Hyaloraphidium curvatum]